MKRFAWVLIALLLLSVWAGFGYYEGVRHGASLVPQVASVDKTVSGLAGHKLYCLGLGIEPCVVATHQPNGPGVLLVPQSDVQGEDAEPDPKETH